MGQPETVRELIGAARETRRAQLPYETITGVAIVIHASLLVTFSLLQIWPMAALNVLSILTFVFARSIMKRGQLAFGLALSVGEVVIHQSLGVYYCGWGVGFQFYLLTVAPLSLMLPRVSTRIGALFAMVPVGTFAALFVLHHYADHTPAYPLPETVTLYLGLGNAISSFAILWVFIVFYRKGAEIAEDALSESAERTERLLFGILPEPIVDRLRESPGVVADSFTEATILFADLVGFTGLAQKKSATELVVMLDEVFAMFDDLVTARGLEKIKTIGDAYMCGGGIPEPTDDHAAEMARLAIEMRDALAQYAEDSGEALQIRIGLHTGPVVAGVIGKSKFAYDLWGDAVNTASRMESHGSPGRVHVSEKTALALAELDGFEIEERGVIEVKGKGQMKTYWLNAAS